MLPPCGVPAVARLKAAGPASSAIAAATPATAVAARRLPSSGTARIATTATMVATSTTCCSSGCQVGVRSSSSRLHQPVTATPAAMISRAATSARARHSNVPPMAITAAIAGASATL